MDVIQDDWAVAGYDYAVSTVNSYIESLFEEDIQEVRGIEILVEEAVQKDIQTEDLIQTILKTLLNILDSTRAELVSNMVENMPKPVYNGDTSTEKI